MSCPDTLVAERAFTDGGAAVDVPADTAFVAMDAANDLWRTEGARLLRSETDVRATDINFDDLVIVDGAASTVEGRPPLLHLPADAVGDAIPGAPTDTQNATVVGTADDLWIPGLRGPESVDGMALFVAHRAAGVWTLEDVAGMAADWTPMVAAADGDRVAVATTHGGEWRVAERGSDGWVNSDTIDEATIDGVVFGGDGNLWAVATQSDGGASVLRPGVCETKLDSAFGAAAIASADAGASVLAVDATGAVQRFTVSASCEVVATPIAGPLGTGYQRTTFSHSGESAILVGRWEVSDDGSGFDFPSSQLCY